MIESVLKTVYNKLETLAQDLDTKEPSEDI
jgi:hypothetical protein